MFLMVWLAEEEAGYRVCQLILPLKDYITHISHLRGARDALGGRCCEIINISTNNKSKTEKEFKKNPPKQRVFPF